MSETRKLAAILVSDVVAYSRLAGADEDRTLARLRTLRSDVIDPIISVHHGRVVKRTGDGAIVEFRSAVDAVRCAIEVQSGVVERNAGLPPEKRIEYRVGIHVGDVVEEEDGDLMGDGVNIAARLEGVCEPGGVCLSEDAYRQVRDRLKEPFVDLGEKMLKNIARPMRVHSLKRGVSTRSSAPAHEKGEPPHLSIVVLPFVNIGGDPEQEYFSDGVTENLTTDLSRIHGAFVIGRSTAFTYKGKVADLKQVGRDLHVRYVLEGSVQRGGNRLRINVQLIDAETGSHVWGERFDKTVADLFDIQDEIVAHVANALSVQLVAAEARRAEKAPDPDSMDLFFQGMALVNKGYAAANMAPARDFFERALAIDPGNVDALVGSAVVDYTAATSLRDDSAKRLAAAESALTKALSLAPDHPMAHLCMGDVFNFTNRAAQAIGEFERALTLDRNFAAAHAHMGFSKILVGCDEETEAHVREALRLSPRDAWVFLWLLVAGTAKLFLGRDEEAVAWLRRSIEANRNGPRTYFCLASALAHLSRLEEARAAVNAGLAVDPGFTVSRARANAFSDNPTYLVRRERFIEGLRMAAVPEG
jgi:TolB-like protein